MQYRLLIRRHGNGWRGIVKQEVDGTFSAGAKKAQPWMMSGFAAQHGTGTLAQAQAVADRRVQDEAQHSLSI